jgi:hypothetical protein
MRIGRISLERKMTIQLTEKEVEILVAANELAGHYWDAMACGCHRSDCEACIAWKKGHDVNDAILPLPINDGMLDVDALNDMSVISECLNAMEAFYEQRKFADDVLKALEAKLIAHPKMRRANGIIGYVPGRS